ncbi:hypothetical protein CIHG_04842 [Coccidioides immitis H538.4]|uniref:Peptidase A1 domain-containing protein n=2 Tax=Coccidioides immitis TaxID=5501 RepID=A0A0J8UHJ1_COCIT|nr:hypothetical protein CIRG_05352 [Coccidioides immitis RMSCC 2394]KMU86903.1 hypothetical protein CIHG_04842 [Coccidioides immitis H538.4]
MALYSLDATASTSISSAASASSSASPAIGWSIPLVGLEDDPKKPWGANVSLGRGDNAGYQVVPIVIGSNGNVNTGRGSSSDVATFPFAVSADPDGDRIFMSPENNTVLSLGVSSSLSFSQISGNRKETIPSVPFCLNLGRKGLWNGSLTLGDHFYDRNRILHQISFDGVPDTNDAHNGTFLISGRQKINNVEMAILNWGDVTRTEQESLPTSEDVILDFNSESVTFPRQDWCGRNVSLTFFGSALNVRIPDYLTKSPDRCKPVENTNPPGAPLILGKPFFQMANILVRPGGDMYLAAANTWDLPPFPETISDMGYIGYPDEPIPPASPTPTPSSGPSEGGS